MLRQKKYVPLRGSLEFHVGAIYVCFVSFLFLSLFFLFTHRHCLPLSSITCGGKQKTMTDTHTKRWNTDVEASFSTELSIERAFFSFYFSRFLASQFISLSFFFWFVVVVTDLYKTAFHVEVFLCGMRGRRSGCCSAYSCVCVCVCMCICLSVNEVRGGKTPALFSFFSFKIC